MILLLLIVAVIALPYVFYSQKTRADTETQKGVNVELQARLEQLQEMNKNRDFYIAETERMQKERDELITSFPGGIDQENYTMFLHYMEYNSMIKAEENFAKFKEERAELKKKIEEDPDYIPAEDEAKYPRFGYEGIDGNTIFLIGKVDYGGNEEIAISDEEVEDGLVGLINDSSIEFATYYSGMKYFLHYILEYEDPMIYRVLTMEFDPDSGNIKGVASIEQYAIGGQGRTLEPEPVWKDIDDEGLRGVMEEGIYGPLSYDTLRNFQEFELLLERRQIEAEMAAEEAGEKGKKDDKDKDEEKDDDK
ncbi:MAG: hypothetical protein IK115_09315 [Lachnospiraceae bacterium]|nr:hypothetical protein [Lachnospiraceae bacterium]